MQIDLSAALGAINAALKEGQAVPGTVQTAGDVVGHIPTGIDVLDAVLGGGWPLGRIIEVFGHESDGKSTLMTHAFVQVQRMGGIPVLVDEEATFDKDRFVSLGGDLKGIIFLESNSLENSFEMIEATVNALRESYPTAPLMIGYDTFAAASPEAELDDGEGMSAKARLSRRFFRRFGKAIGKQRVCLLVLNQTIDNINKPGEPETTPGGRGLKFHASLRIKVSRAGWIGDPEDKSDKPRRIGMRVRLRLVKSKICEPHQEISTVLLFQSGFDNRYTAMEALSTEDEDDPLPIKLSGSSSWKRLVTGELDVKFQSMKKYLALFEQYPDLQLQMRKLAFKRFAPGWWKRASKAVRTAKVKIKGEEVPCRKLACEKCPRFVSPEKVADAKVAQCPLVAAKRAIDMAVPSTDLRIYVLRSKGKKGKGKKPKTPKSEPKDD